MTIDKHTTGYTCFVHTYAIFVSLSEVDCDASEILQAFAGIDHIEKFFDLGLDFVRYSTVDEEHDLSQGVKPKLMPDKSTVIEIDLSKPKKIKAAMEKATGK